MTISKSTRVLIVSVLLAIGAVFMLPTLNVSAQEGDTEEAVPVTTSETEANLESEEESTNESYDYIAQPGDSYSLMARKAIQTYGVNNSVNLSGAQIIYAETNLTQIAGSPVLVLGQQVTISEELVSEWVSSAQDLTDEQQALWQPYANNANFNTNSVGQSQE